MNIIGEKFTSVDEMNEKQIEAEGWTGIGLHQIPFCLTFESFFMFPSMDPESNGPGAISIQFPGDEIERTADLDDLKTLVGVGIRAYIFKKGCFYPGLLFEDGTKLFPLRDPEQNGEGIFFGVNSLSGDGFYIWASPEELEAR